MRRFYYCCHDGKAINPCQNYEGSVMEKKAARWWDKLGKPQYGGELTFRLNRKIVNFDPYFGHHLTQIHTGWMERLNAADWTQDLSATSHDNKKALTTRIAGFSCRA